jgi:radical SAM/Cys-rich protein
MLQRAMLETQRGPRAQSPATRPGNSAKRAYGDALRSKTISESMPLTEAASPPLRRLPIAPAAQLDISFDALLERHGQWPLTRARVRTLQINLGKRCNQACLHCHVDAGPQRTEAMTRAVAERVVQLLAHNSGVEVVDITGGAPELNPNFRWLVKRARDLGCEVIDRCNLTVLSEPGMEGLDEFLLAHQVHIIASLPCYQPENVDKQRGKNVFERSIEALCRLNALGYGRRGSRLQLDLVYNPIGPSLPAPQADLERQYKHELALRYGIEFHRLLTLTNVPIARFAHALDREDKLDGYMRTLSDAFNPSTVSELMCRSLVSVSWDGRLYDCDFNQMREIELGAADVTGMRTIWEVASLDELASARVATAEHCLACTAGSGSGCSGALR